MTSRKSILFCLLTIIVKISSAQVDSNPVPVPPGGLTLQNCYELAVLRSETIGIKDADIKVAQARYWQAVGAVLPHIHFIAGETLQNSGSSSDRSSTSSTGSGTSSSFGGNNTDQYAARINVKQPIFSGFRDQAIASAGKANIAAGKYSKHRQLQLLYLDVSDVFYQILAYQDDLKTLLDIQKTLQNRIDELSKRVNIGRSRPGELIAARTDYAQSLVTIEQVKGLLGASKELLSFLIEVPSSSIEVTDNHPLPTAEALVDYLQKSGDRPDVLAAVESSLSERKQLSAAKSEHWPTISAEGNYYVQQIPDTSRQWNVSLTFDLPIFEGGAIEARVNEHKALVRASELNLELLRRTADKDVKTAYNNFIASIAQNVRVEEALKLSEENYRIQTEDYRKGIVSNLDVLDALRRLYDLRRQHLSTSSDVRLNLIRLHVAAGDLKP